MMTRMYRLLGLVVFFSLYAGFSFADVESEVKKEKLFFETLRAIQSKDSKFLQNQVRFLNECKTDCTELQTVFLMAFEESENKQIQNISKILLDLDFSKLKPQYLIRLKQLVRLYNKSTQYRTLVSELLKKHRLTEVVDTACAYADGEIVSPESCRRIKNTSFTKKQIKDLFDILPTTEKYFDGSYANTVRLFMFCREDRIYPCLMVMKDSKDQPVYETSGKLWSQPSLGLSSRALPHNVTNGQTPQGVYQMDGVMPAADQQLYFGQFRRVILHFISPSFGEENHKYVLPESHFELDWWREAVEARNVGRDLLRIHGTGRVNQNPHSTYYPLLPTSGCISKRENTYDGIVYKDQRFLLDQLMWALGVDPIFENEVNVKGLLYVVNLNDEQKEVALSDLEAYGIK